VKELLDELKEIDNAIAQHASEHIHANEVILTFAAPRTAKLFLQQAAKKRSFQVHGRLLLTLLCVLRRFEGGPLLLHSGGESSDLRHHNASCKGGPFFKCKMRVMYTSATLATRCS